jgi:hypothetical protein
MAAEAYWADTATLSLETGSATSVPVAGLQGLIVVPSVSIEKLYTGDSIKIDQQQQHEFMVQVDIDISKWDLELYQQWLGGEGASSPSMADTSDPEKFTATGDFESVGGTNAYTWEVSGITFEEMPLLDFSRGEFIEKNLSGEGEDLVDVSEQA